MEANHTPGPWFINPGFSDWNLPKRITIYVEGLKIAEIESITPNPLGSNKQDREKAAIASANANLMAAAPDLLEALRDLLTEIALEHGPDWDNRRPHYKAVYAIAKAEGRN